MVHPVRVIPRLDIKGPNLIKGIQMEGYRALGTAEAFADLYYTEGADELFYQDVVASLFKRSSLFEIVSRTAKKSFIPLTVGGGIRSVADIREMLRAGADKVAINTAAVLNPKLISEGARIFGSQCIVCSIDTFCLEGKYQVWTDYAREVTSLDAIEWAKKVVDLGAGEIILTSINNEGTGRGYDLRLIENVASQVPVPVIASGGAGKPEHLAEAISHGASAVAAASVFHYNYSRPMSSYTVSFSEKRLRMGEQIDSGNLDFLNNFYGGVRCIPTGTFSISEAKMALKNAGIAVREVEEAAGI